MLHHWVWHRDGGALQHDQLCVLFVVCLVPGTAPSVHSLRYPSGFEFKVYAIRSCSREDSS